MAHHSPLLRRGPGVGGTANLYERVLTLAEVASRAPRAPRAMPASSGASQQRSGTRSPQDNALQDSKAIILPVAGNITASYNFCNIGYAVQLMRLEHPVLASFSPRRAAAAGLRAIRSHDACRATRSLHTKIGVRASALAGVPVRRFARQRPDLP